MHMPKYAMYDLHPSFFFCFFFNDTATTEIYTLSLHDALPICPFGLAAFFHARGLGAVLHQHRAHQRLAASQAGDHARSEEHTSELQSPCNLVCRLLLEKNKTSSSGRATAPTSCFTLSGRISRS